METNARRKTPSRGKKIFYFLSRLSADEKRAFSDWLASPLHGNSSQFAEMLAILLAELETNSKPSISPAQFNDLLMPDRPLDAKKEAYIWVRVSHFQSELFDFLAWKHYQQDASLQKSLFLKEIVYRGWEKYIPNAYDAGIKALATPPQAARFRVEMEVEMAYSHYLAGTKSAQDKHLAEVNLALDAYYILQKLKYACAAVLDHKPAKSDDQIDLLPTILSQLAEKIGQMPLVIQAYWYAYQMLAAEIAEEEKAKTYYFDFVKCYQDPSDFALDEAMDLFIHAQNFCTLRFRKGEGEFVDHLQSLYDKVLASEIALQEGLMPPSFYKNTVELMCRMERFVWVEEFVEAFRERILDDPNRCIYAYNLAVLRFYQKDFANVISQLNNIVFELDHFQIGEGARVYLCQALWEKGELEWLQHVLKAFLQHLRRDKRLTSRMRERYKGFANYLLSAVVATFAQPNRILQGLQKIQADIEANEPKNMHRWLRAKLQDAIEDQLS